MLAAAIMLVAAFAGIAVFDGEEAYAAEGDQVTVTFMVGDVSYGVPLAVDAEDKFTLPTLADLNVMVPQGQIFNGWFKGDDTSIAFVPGTKVKYDSTSENKFVADLDPITYTIQFLDKDGKAIVLNPDDVKDGADPVTSIERTYGEATYTAPADL